MKTIEIALYEFEELTENGREKALQEYAYFNVDDDWWRNVYEDAKMVGIELNSFDLYRSNYCNGDFIKNAISCAKLICLNHGENTETYKISDKFINCPNVTEDDELNFRDLLLGAYLKLLKHEYEYLTSEEGIIDTIKPNDYLFMVDGSKGNKLERLARTIKVSTKDKTNQ
ncbi:hypothetical protein FO440_18255 [Mucilaginibacter corticis]|uniref:Uncharacterized protein n=1 Tax=Mucilaginibacter corticis TaxID=2597670 RepID=A0A556MIJ8_9SPHI|nr:hypothetical protein [Mucilaginibacter corticis]TSJ39682.1 hypothetical protein FO440_18255 [Mucilaginibacter corticis]